MPPSFSIVRNKPIAGCKCVLSLFCHIGLICWPELRSSAPLSTAQLPAILLYMQANTGLVHHWNMSRPVFCHSKKDRWIPHLHTMAQLQSQVSNYNSIIISSKVILSCHIPNTRVAIIKLSKSTINYS